MHHRKAWAMEPCHVVGTLKSNSRPQFPYYCLGTSPTNTTVYVYIPTHSSHHHQ